MDDARAALASVARIERLVRALRAVVDALPLCDDACCARYGTRRVGLALHTGGFHAPTRYVYCREHAEARVSANCPDVEHVPWGEALEALESEERGSDG